MVAVLLGEMRRQMVKRRGLAGSGTTPAEAPFTHIEFTEVLWCLGKYWKTKVEENGDKVPSVGDVF
jgi:hypothetical protein